MRVTKAIVLSLSVVTVAKAKLEIALSADRFVDSIGINIADVDEVSPSSPYADQSNVTASIKDLGIRHIRVMPIPSTKEIQSFVRIANGAGAKLDLMLGRNNSGQWAIDTKRNVIAASNSLALRKNYLIPYLPSLEYIEGPNESSCHANHPYLCTDGRKLRYPEGTIAYQNALLNTLRNPASSYDSSPPILLPLIGPSGCMTNVSAGPLKGCGLDFENIHSYADNGFGPDWGLSYGGRYPGSFDYIANADAIKGNGSSGLPIIITETGYNTGSTPEKGIQLPVSQRAQAKYYPRLFSTALLVQRVEKIYTWELFDFSKAKNANANYGLVALGADGKTLVKKPAYIAEKSLIKLLEERGASYSPRSLDFSISAPAQVAHLLLQKSDHDYYLLLWQDVPVYGYSNGKGSDINNPDVSVEINFKNSFISATQYTYNSEWSFSAAPFVGADQLKISVPDTVTVLQISGL